KYFPAAKDQEQAAPLFTIITPGRLRVCVPVETPDFNQLRENMRQAASEHKRSDGKKPRYLRATLRVHGLGSSTWPGQVVRLEESEAKSIPIALSSKGGGPVAVKAQPGAGGALIPQAQHYLVYVDIMDESGTTSAVEVGVMAQVKIHCKPETCLRWLWR